MNALTEFDAMTGEVLPPATGLYAAVAAQMDKSLTTARAFPRSLARVGQVLSQFVSADEKFTESCLYSLKRGGRTIQGPSARFAEALAYAYGHLRVDARLVEEGKDYIVVRGEAHDLERNIIFAQDVTRRIVDSKGRRFDVDLISVTYMAAASIAQRDCILKSIPSFIWRPAFEAVLQRITGDVKTLADRRVKAIGQFAVLGVSAEQVFRKIGVASINEVTADHLVELVGTFQAIRAGDTTVEAEFGDTKITTKSLGGSPLAAPEDTGDPVVSAAGVAGEAQADSARVLVDTAAANVPKRDHAQASQEEIEKHPLTPQIKAMIETMAASKPSRTKPKEKGWGPYGSFEEALSHYENDLLASGNVRGLRAAAVDWGGRAYWTLNAAQSEKADAAYDAAKSLFERREKESSALAARGAYEAGRTETDIDSATEVYQDPPDTTVGEAVEFEAVPSEHPHGLSLADFTSFKPRDPASMADWETIVNRLLQSRNESDPMAIFLECEAEGLIGKLGEDDQNDLRAIRFKIKQALKR